MPAGDLGLFPQPRHVEPRDAGPPADAAVRTMPVDRLPPQGFELELDGHGITIRHRDDAGLRYARATLRQLQEQPRTDGERLPGLLIRDWPDFVVRGFMLDISRDRVPTRETLERMVGLMELTRLNQLQLYTEHTFAYRDHEVVWRDASPMTPDDIGWLDRLCRDAGIELVPNQNCFGHMERWLRHDAYRKRAETPDGFELLPGLTRPPAVLAPTPDNAAFVRGLLDELLPLFPSRRINVGCDETFELGRGASRDEVARRGKERVYVDHVRRIVDPLVADGHQVQIWADILRKSPELAAELPDGVVPVAWTYEAPPKDGSRPEVPVDIARVLAEAGIDTDAHLGFEANVAPLVEAQVPFWVAPGTSSWSSLVGRIDNAVTNLIDAAEVGRRYGSDGFLITDWGDNGHLQPPSVSFGPMLFGGAVSWGLDTNRDLDLPSLLDRVAFGDGTATLGGALHELGQLWRQTGRRAFNCSPLEAALLSGKLYMVDGRADPAKLVDVIDRLDAAIDAIGASAPTANDGEIVRQELVTAARLARHGAWRLLARIDGAAPAPAMRRADLAELIDEHRTCWLERCRPGGLADSAARLQSTLDTYTA